MTSPAPLSRISCVAELRQFYDEPKPVVLQKVLPFIDGHATAFLENARFAAINLHVRSGVPAPVLAGGEAGFVRVIDSALIEFEVPRASVPATMLSKPLAAGIAAGMLFIVPGVKEVVRTRGWVAAEVIDCAVHIEHRIEAVFFHCAKALMRSRIWGVEAPATRWTGLRSFECVRKVRESAVITSFYLKPSDGGPAPAFKPGQHAPVEIPLANGDEPARRAYSLSNRPGEGVLRISVKKEVGTASASCHLHDRLEVGGSIQMRHPGGQFFLDEASGRPVVLLSAGVGLTPMMSMFEHLGATRSPRRVWFVHAAISGREHAMGDRVREVARSNPNARVHVAYERPRIGEDRPGVDYDSEGRLSIALLKSFLSWDDYEFYVCGPGPFMKGMIVGLLDTGIRPDRVRWEAFGGDKIVIDTLAGTAATDATPAAEGAQVKTIEFRKAGKVVEWHPGCASLLDLAEANGVKVSSSCRSGECFSCVTRVLSGQFCHTRALEDEPDEGSALICSAQPTSDLVLDL